MNALPFNSPDRINTFPFHSLKTMSVGPAIQVQPDLPLLSNWLNWPRSFSPLYHLVYFGNFTTYLYIFILNIPVKLYKWREKSENSVAIECILFCLLVLIPSNYCSKRIRPVIGLRFEQAGIGSLNLFREGAPLNEVVQKGPRSVGSPKSPKSLKPIQACFILACSQLLGQPI